MKILSQNIWTPFIGSKSDIARIDEFVKNVGDYDLVMIQEAFIFTLFFMRFWGRDLYLEDKLKENGFEYFLKGSRTMFFQNNGLLVASKYPIELISEIEFEDNEDDEFFTKKGALFFKLTNNPLNKDIVFVNTHLHCGSGYKLYRDIRNKQLKNIHDELQKKNINSDIVLAGDLNIDALEPEATIGKEYFSIINNFGQIYDPLKNKNEVTSPPNGRLDYIILIKHDYLWIENSNVVKIGSNNEAYPDGISDHYGVEAELVTCSDIK